MKLKIFHIIIVKNDNDINNDFSLELEDSDENNFSTDDRGDDKLNSITNEIKCSCLFDFVLVFRFCFFVCFFLVFCFRFSLEVGKCSRSRAK